MTRPLSRFVTFGLLGIVLPAIIVAALAWVSLRQWERSSELLRREQARDLATMAADKVSMVLRVAEDELLSRLEATLRRAPLADSPRASNALRLARPSDIDALLAAVPLIQRLYLVDRRGTMAYPTARRDDDAAVLDALRAHVSSDVWEHGGRRELLVGDHVLIAVVVRSHDGSPMLAALLRDADVLRRDVLARTLGGLEAPTIAAVFDHRDRPVYSRASVDGAERVTAVTFRDELPNWRIALYQPAGSGPARMVRRQIMLFTIAFGVLIAIIAAGIVATWRLTRRETEMARLKSDFVANVSHDLKTPLSVIRMFGETLEMDRVTSDAQRQEYYRVITRETERLSRLIDNVLDFSRIEGGRRTYRIVPTALEPLVRETVDAFAYPLAQRGFKVDIRIDPDLPDVPVDAAALSQALANLVDNAIKYSDDRTSLRIDVTRCDRGVAIDVVDEGVGIPRDEHQKIFEKFYRVGRSETQTRRGSGVGLALVRHVAEAHGGRVSVESEPGVGSRFTLWLPV